MQTATPGAREAWTGSRDAPANPAAVKPGTTSVDNAKSVWGGSYVKGAISSRSRADLLVDALKILLPQGEGAEDGRIKVPR